MELKQRTKLYALSIIRLCSALPKNETGKIISRQLLRSGTSVGANTRAAFRGRSNKEFIAKIGIVIEEADESLYWLELLTEGEIVPNNKQLVALKKETEEIIAIFVSIKDRHKS